MAAAVSKLEDVFAGSLPGTTELSSELDEI
jgi:hypothetical protein